ncbi:DUF3828 domain-containing protein [Runella slithyformis]|uniref:DUF3828 domain-containing protein n=1 Tax=Runella slithyformis (strain ATCC 29530 / DSM 19594 / LMG 11500 / NCIMB 11436 / LSU 4) TaxID=761193 RepID=A0A7U3ZNN9_RUNSL|nr:DUF3828 domain-containing protein [Runella slithyformis]AEI50537.1 hypothetical protein Runsl_4193 [Runella slithyformis DSM 19594]
MKSILFFLIFFMGISLHSLNAQTPSAGQVANDFYKWYLTKGVNLGWRQVVKRSDLTPGFQKRLTVFFQKMEKDNEGGYDPILQAQDFEEKFSLKPVLKTPTKATFDFWMFGQKVALVTLVNNNNKWLIDAIQGLE